MCNDPKEFFREFHGTLINSVKSYPFVLRTPVLNSFLSYKLKFEENYSFDMVVKMGFSSINTVMLRNNDRSYKECVVVTYL